MKNIITSLTLILTLAVSFFYLGKKNEKLKNEQKKNEKNEKAIKLALKPRPNRSTIIKWLSRK